MAAVPLPKPQRAQIQPVDHKQPSSSAATAMDIEDDTTRVPTSDEVDYLSLSASAALTNRVNLKLRLVDKQMFPFIRNICFINSFFVLLNSMKVISLRSEELMVEGLAHRSVFPE